MSEQTARDRIRRFTEENQREDAPPCDPETGHAIADPKAHLDTLLDAYAHELAERAYAREVGVPLEDGAIVSAGDVIDLIDPGAGPVRPDEEPTP
jgi:hypothetical protein